MRQTLHCAAVWLLLAILNAHLVTAHAQGTAFTYTLHQNSNLANGSGWTTSGYSITTANGKNSITITSPTGNLFFRLANP